MQREMGRPSLAEFPEKLGHNERLERIDEAGLGSVGRGGSGHLCAGRAIRR